MMEYTVFPQMNTLVRMQELTLLTDAQKIEFSRAANIEAVYKTLTSSGFFHHTPPREVQLLRPALETEALGWLDWAKGITPETRLTDIFLLPYVAHNIRLYAKERLTGKDLSALYYQNVPFAQEKLSELANAKPAATEPEASIQKVLEHAISDFGVHGSFSRIDLIVKFFFHLQLLRLAGEIGNEHIRRALAAQIDLDLLSVLLQQRKAKRPLNEAMLTRATAGTKYSPLLSLFSATPAEQDAFLRSTPYASLWAAVTAQHNGGLFDVYADNYLIDLCKKAKLEAFGLFPLFAFLYVKLADIKNLQVLIAAKQSGANPNEIAERLRSGYEL